MMDNSNLSAKVALRKHFLNELPASAKILECFAGEERKIYNKCYTTNQTTSLDKKKITGVVCCNNQHYITSNDLNQYDVFDLDAYGDPYVLVLNIIHRLAADGKERCLVITDGLHRNLIYGNCPGILLTTMNNSAKVQIPCLNRHHDFLIKLFLAELARKYNVEIKGIKIYRDESVNHMLYYGFLFCKNQPEPTLLKINATTVFNKNIVNK